MATAGLMLAHQVAGKAVRDSFFLSNYPASDLPRMVMAAAAVSLVLVLLFTRAMERFGPRRLVPAGFLLSSLAHFTEHALVPGAPGVWSVVIYLHIVGFGAILLSGFWSQMSESFDPRAAKQTFGRITGAGTLGGIAGGLAAERVAALFSDTLVLLMLAGLHLLCAVALTGMRRVTAPPPEPAAPPPGKLLERAPYLKTIAVMVLAATASAAILDYLFKAGAGAAFGKGAPLLRFFAIFYTATQAVTFLAQATLSRPALQRMGIGRSMCALPCGVAAGSLGALLVPALPVFALLRSLELVLRGSLYRSGYELLYTPVPPADKRAAKTLIDVACDRAGDALGGAMVQSALWMGVAFLSSELLGAAMLLAVLAAWAALRLDRTYSGLVQQRLVDRAVELDISGIQDSTTRSAIISARAPRAAAPAPSQPPSTADATLDAVRELRSGDGARILAALEAIERPDPVVAAQMLRLLAWDEVAGAVQQALMRDPCPITGLLIDNLVNEDVPFGIRRRVPRILGRCERQLAVQGLLDGLGDTRFEVRFQCSRALDSLLQRSPGLAVPAEAVFAAVERELRVARPIWESRRLLDRRDATDPHAFLDEVLRERADQSLEHIFSLFATVLPRDPVKIAFRALHTDDRILRGLAAEYLDGVLPTSVRERLWSMVEPGPATPSTRPHEEALADLLRSHHSLLLQIKDAGKPMV